MKCNIFKEIVSCEYGYPLQTTSLSILEECSIHLFKGGLSGINKLENGAIKWLDDLKIGL